MITVVEQEIYGSSLCFWGDTRPVTGATGGVFPGVNTFFGETYAINPSSITLYYNKDPQINGSFPPTQKRIKRISLEPTWSVSDLNPSSVTQPTEPLPTTYTVFFKDIKVQPFIASHPLNNLTQNFFGFSASDNVEWQINQWGPTSSTDVVNDVHFSDECVLNPWESLKLKFNGADIGGSLPGNSPFNPVRYAMWTEQFFNKPIFKVRVELEEFSPSSQYFHRVNLNDIALKIEGISYDQDVTLLDFRSTSPTLNDPPFNSTQFTSFKLENLDFRGAYPWGGINTTKFMYSIMLHTEGDPSATRYIRKYVRFAGGAASDLEINGLLKDIGPLQINKGQWLTARLYSFESAIPALTEAHSARQMPAFWLNGTIT